MKKLIIINGTMGVGKTTICRELNKQINRSAWLDGDWCWTMNPWVFDEENKKMVIDNISYILSSFLANSNFDYVIFSWVIHQEEIFDMVLDKLKEKDYSLEKITLICSEGALIDRMKKNNRTDEGINTSIQRLILYKDIKTIKIDTTHLSIDETISKVLEIVK